MAIPGVRTRYWTRAEYDELVARGTFRPDERLELLDGALVVREPQGSRHVVAIELALGALQAAFGSGWRVRVQLPVALDEGSEPEPDLSVVAGDPRLSSAMHPANPALIVEVAETSVGFDRDLKGSLYARAGVPDFWIVNLAGERLEVYREPLAAPRARFGHRYSRRRLLVAGDTVGALSAPLVPIADLLP